MPEPRIKIKLGELLLQQGLISHDQLRIALMEQGQTDIPLGRILVQLGFLTENVLRDIIAHSTGEESIDLASVAPDAEAISRVPESFARRHRILPIAFDTKTASLTVATTNIFNIVALDQLRALLNGNLHIKPALASETQLEEYIDRFYGYRLSVDSILAEIENGEINASGDGQAQPVVRLVDALLTDAVKRGASDIHFEPEHAFLRIRYRIDGVLQQIRSLHKSYWPSITVRLKIVGNMDIAETRAPQDGRFSIAVFGRTVDFRMASHPTIHGENITLRVLDRAKSIMPLEQMGLRPAIQDQLRQLLATPEGMLAITGPTGSGKTTTLYSLLAMLNTESVNIMTLEDPVEYPLTLMRQTSMTDAHKLDFAGGIRSLLRQDPDIILVGEIRDRETAEMAFRAAMTGHQVFSTLHANSALGAFARLLDIGVSPEIMAGNMIGIIAQRLVRRLCPHCKTPGTPTDEECRILGLDGGNSEIFYPVGCQRCHFTGYMGRMAIMELLHIDAAFDSLIARRATLDELREAALWQGYAPLAQDGKRCVLEGQTSLDEIRRVVNISQWK